MNWKRWKRDIVWRIAEIVLSGRRFLVLRVPGSGPPALAGPPNDFATAEEAEARIREIEANHRKAHHTYLVILPYSGKKSVALTEAGVLF